MPEQKFLENFDPPAETVEPTTPPPATSPAPEPKVEPAAVGEPIVDATKAAEPKVDKESEAFKAAALDERHKRQKAEQEIAYWRGRAESAKTPEIEEDAKKKALDLENRFLTSPVEFTENLIQEKINAAVLQDRWDRSIFNVEREHNDWAAKRDAFLKMATDDPTLEAKAMRHPDPARYAYEYVKQREMSATPLDLEAERKKIREEERAAARKELALSDAQGIPQSLAGANGSGGGGSVVKDHDVNALFENKAF